MSNKFDSLNGLAFNDQQKEIADKFAELVFDQPGWYRGTIDYMLDENGKVVRIDGLKVTMTGAGLPTEFFRKGARGVPFLTKGCRKRLAPGQWWAFCGETDMGQSAPALCTNCGGEYKLDDQE